MHVVLATDLLDGPGGSETYLVTVAENLVRLGHRVSVHARRFGALADRAAQLGAEPVAETELPDDCDAVLVQDVGMAHGLAARWPGRPQVVVAHSPFFDFQLPPVLPVPGSVVVVLNDRVRRRVEAMDLGLEIVRLRQPIDTRRFSIRGAPRPTPRRVLLLGNYLQGPARAGLVEAWTAAGLELAQVGVATEQSLDPAAVIAEHDIVVGKGRAILEAMACGRPAFVYDAFGSDGWVTPATYDALERDGFAGQSDPAVLDDAALVRALDGYDAGIGRVNRELVLKHHQDRSHTESLVGLFLRLRPPASTATGTTPHQELARLGRLRWAADNENFGLRRQVEELTARALRAEEAAGELGQRAEESTRRADEAERERDRLRRRLARKRDRLREAEARTAGANGTSRRRSRLRRGRPG